MQAQYKNLLMHAEMKQLQDKVPYRFRTTNTIILVFAGTFFPALLWYTGTFFHSITAAPVYCTLYITGTFKIVR
jgi:hypothetical protein